MLRGSGDGSGGVSGDGDDHGDGDHGGVDHGDADLGRKREDAVPSWRFAAGGVPAPAEGKVHVARAATRGNALALVVGTDAWLCRFPTTAEDLTRVFRDRKVLPRLDEEAVVDVGFSGDGRVLATFGQSGRVGVWKPETGELVGSVDTSVARRAADGASSSSSSSSEREFLIAGAVSFDGSVVATASDGDAVRLWSVRDAKVLVTLRGSFKDSKRRLALSHDLEFVAQVADSGHAHIWETRTGKEVDRFTGECYFQRVTDVSFTSSGLLLSCEFELVTVREPSCRADLRFSRKGVVWPAWYCYVVRMAHSHDGSVVVIASGNDGVSRWEGHPLRLLQGSRYLCLGAAHVGGASHVVLSADTRAALTVGNVDSLVRLWRLYGLVEEATLATLGSETWRRFWKRDGDRAVWSRVLALAGLGCEPPGAEWEGEETKEFVLRVEGDWMSGYRG